MILIGLIIFIVIWGWGILMLLDDQKELNVVSDKDTIEIEVAKDVGMNFFEDFISVAPPANNIEIENRILKTLSEKALEEIGSESLIRDLALFIGIQDVPDEGIEFVDIKMNDIGTVLLTVQLKYSSTPTTRIIHLVYENESWKVDNITTSPQPSFSKSGNLTKGNPGSLSETWILVYEEPGAPAMTKEVIFAPSSTCAIAGVEVECETIDLEVGSRVKITGFVQGDIVEIMNLEYLEE